MKHRNYSENEVVLALQKKHDIQIQGNIITVLKGKSALNDIGIKSKGKIDFLQKYQGYILLTTTEPFKKGKRH